MGEVESPTDSRYALTDLFHSDLNRCLSAFLVLPFSCSLIHWKSALLSFCPSPPTSSTELGELEFC